MLYLHQNLFSVAASEQEDFALPCCSENIDMIDDDADDKEDCKALRKEVSAVIIWTIDRCSLLT